MKQSLVRVVFTSRKLSGGPIVSSFLSLCLLACHVRMNSLPINVPAHASVPRWLAPRACTSVLSDHIGLDRCVPTKECLQRHCATVMAVVGCPPSLQTSSTTTIAIDSRLGSWTTPQDSFAVQTHVVCGIFFTETKWKTDGTENKSSDLTSFSASTTAMLFFWIVSVRSLCFILKDSFVVMLPITTTIERRLLYDSLFVVPRRSVDFVADVFVAVSVVVAPPARQLRKRHDEHGF